MAPGRATLTAAVRGASASVDLRVVPAGGIGRLTLTPGKPAYDPRFKNVLAMVKGRHVQFDLLIGGMKPSDTSTTISNGVSLGARTWNNASIGG